MERASHAFKPQSLYELSWAHGQDAKLVLDVDAGLLVDVNPAFETLMGCSRENLVGTHCFGLHPEDEHERVKDEFSKLSGKAAVLTGFHILRKNDHSEPVPVQIWSSDSMTFDGRDMLVVEYRDISDRLERQHLIETQNWALGAYAVAALALGRVHSTEDLLLQSICDGITHQSAYVLAWVGIAEDGPGKPIRVAASAGSASGHLDGMQWSWGEDEPSGQGPTAICIRTNTVQVLEDAKKSPVSFPGRKRARQLKVRSSISVPIRIEGRWHGALVVYSKLPDAFGETASDVFERLAGELVHSIEALEQKELLRAERMRLTKAQTDLANALSAMVAPIVLAMEMRDPYTAGHQGRVAEIAIAIGKEMGWAGERLQALRMAAMVHDIGKISIPAEILTKPGNLTAAERDMMNQHPETGYAILKDIPFMWPVAEMVHQHHEKLDGSGYPRGLKADEILPEAKVLAVADIVEAMASYRPYRPGIKLHLVLQQIEKDAGTLLDAEVVRTCVALFREKHFTVPGWIRR
jgi:PAS domain S-box-containing protein/putative nucleotidyltransferase with HDIG domain